MPNMELKVGELAPDFKLPSSTGGEISLSDYRGKKVVLFFVREYIWIQCRAHVAQLGRSNDIFEKADAQVLVILGDDLEHAKSYAELLKAPFTILADPDREVYLRYELVKNFIGIQRTASVILDKNGLITYLERATNPNTWLLEYKKLSKAIENN